MHCHCNNRFVDDGVSKIFPKSVILLELALSYISSLFEYLQLVTGEKQKLSTKIKVVKRRQTIWHESDGLPQKYTGNY